MGSSEVLKAMDSSSRTRSALRCLLLLAFVGTYLVTFYLGASWRASPGYGSGFGSSLSPSLDPDRVYLSSLVKDLVSQLNLTQTQLRSTEILLHDVQAELAAARGEFVQNSSDVAATRGAAVVAASGDAGDEPWLRWGNIMRRGEGALSKELLEFVAERKLPLGWSGGVSSYTILSPVGHSCALLQEDLNKYMEYEVGGQCPDDQALAHSLTVHGCEPLPRRRCFAATPTSFPEPYAFPDCLWTIPPNGSILWTAYSCKSFECLNDRKNKNVFQDCIDCFELYGREKHRWTKHGSDLDLSVDEVLDLKGGSIRIGLDIGGGPGTFAVRMREKNVTIITTSLNLNGPFNNFIALRGVLPLHLSISQRLPFFDNTLDIIHSMHVISNWIPAETLEFLLFDIDRVLRPGGLFWLDRFFCIRHQLEEIYIPLIEKLRYNKLKWAIGNKVDRGPTLQEVYLTAVLEKPISAPKLR